MKRGCSVAKGATDIARSSGRSMPMRPFQELQVDRRRRSPTVGAD